MAEKDKFSKELFQEQAEMIRIAEWTESQGIHSSDHWLPSHFNTTVLGKDCIKGLRCCLVSEGKAGSPHFMLNALIASKLNYALVHSLCSATPQIPTQTARSRDANLQETEHTAAQENT